MSEIKLIITNDDLIQLDAEDKWIEVVDGVIVESVHQVTHLHQVIIENLYDLLKPYVKSRKLGRVHTEGLRYILIGSRKNIDLARKPDLSFIRAGRIPDNYDWQGDFEGTPDFAVEVASPGQTTTILLEKITDYLKTGCDEAWLIIPWKKEVYRYRGNDDAPDYYTEGDTIETPLFRDLQIDVQALFDTEA